MTDRMPDFAMPSDEELAAERRAEAVARARAADPTSALRERLGLEQEPVDETALAFGDPDADAEAGTDAEAGGARVVAPALPPPDPAARIHSRRADRPARVPSAARRRVLAIVRNPVVAFAAGAVLVASGFLAAPALTTWTERGTLAELERVLDDYVAAVNEGDVEAALGLHQPDDGAGSTALLDAGVAPSSLPSVVCDAPRPGRSEPDSATAQCSMSVEGFGTTGATMSVRLERVDGSWRLAAGLEQQAFVTPALFELVSIAGVPMAGVLEPDEDGYWLLPGGYEIETRTSDLVELTDYGGLLVADGGGYLNVYAQVSDAVRADVEATALAYAQGCVVDEATAAACGIAQPPDGRELTASSAQDGYAQDGTTFGIPVRIAGTATVAAPNVEVLVHFDESWTTYELEVTGVTTMYG